MVQIKCERLECSFLFVSEVFLFNLIFSNNLIADDSFFIFVRLIYVLRSITLESDFDFVKSRILSMYISTKDTCISYSKTH